MNKFARIAQGPIPRAKEKPEPKALRQETQAPFAEKTDFGNRALYELLSESARKHADQTCIYYNGKKMTYREVDEESSKFASALVSMGLNKGDRVALVLPNTPQFVISYYGTLKAGGIVVACSLLYKPHELEHQLKDSGAKIVVATKDIVKEKTKRGGATVKTENDLFSSVKLSTENIGISNVIATSVTDYLPSIKRHLSRFAGIRNVEREGTTDFVKLIRGSKPIESPAEVNSRDDIALLQYTGGTTGISKAAMLTHYNLYSNAAYTSLSFPMTKDDVSLCVLPLYHIYGMTATMNSAIYSGAKLVLLPKFHVEEVMKTIQDQKVTLFCAVPAIYIAIINNPKAEKFDMHSVRLCMSGGAGLPAAVRDKFMKMTGGNLVEGYGLSEASPVTHCNPLHGGSVKESSIGLAVTETEAKVVDIDDHSITLKPGEVGELAVKGPQVMKGYWNNPSETERVLKDGWLFTGDIAKMDDEGYFYIVDRKKDMINVGGLKVYPREVEEVLFKHSAIKEAAAIAIPDSFSGEVVKAFVVLKEPSDKITEKEVIAYCSTMLAKYKVPKQVEFVDELPKTLIGKVLRRELKEKEQASQQGQP